MHLFLQYNLMQQGAHTIYSILTVNPGGEILSMLVKNLLNLELPLAISLI